MRFTCPDCGGHNIEEVMEDVIVASRVINVWEGGDIDYGEQTNDGGVVDRFQCETCGWEIPAVTNGEELFEYLNKRRRLH